MKFDKDGCCDGNLNDYRWCGYCAACNYRWKAVGGDIDERRKSNWEWCMLYDKKMQAAKAKALRALWLSTGNENCIKHTFLTISLPKDYDLKKMLNLTEKIQSSNLYGLGDSIASFEWFSEKNPDGGNLHIHLLVVNGTKKYKPSVVARKVALKFGIEDNFVDIINGNSDFLHRLNYVCGIKVKGSFVGRDRKWRLDNELPQVTCYLPEEFKLKFENELATARGEL